MMQLPHWTAIQKADLLSRWAFNQMLIGVATRKYARSVRVADGDLAGQAKRATTRSSVSRRFVALSTASDWHRRNRDKHVLAVALGATENAAVVKALLADLIERGLRPDIAPGLSGCTRAC